MKSVFETTIQSLKPKLKKSLSELKRIHITLGNQWHTHIRRFSTVFAKLTEIMKRNKPEIHNLMNEFRTKSQFLAEMETRYLADNETIKDLEGKITALETANSDFSERNNVMNRRSKSSVWLPVRDHM
jgi:chromosome segregation ATPase